MEQLEHLPELGQFEKGRVDEVVATLNSIVGRGEAVAELAHDARNMLTALDLYCDLLQQPGVLAEPFVHYGGELRLVAAASRRLVEKLTQSPDTRKEDENLSGIFPARGRKNAAASLWKSVPAEPVRNLAEELLANRNLLASLAGPTIAVTVDVQGGALPIRVTSEDLTRMLVNLTRNAAEAMSGIGRIHISLRESSGEPDNSPWVTINIEDNGPGLSEQVLARIFEPASPKREGERVEGGWPMSRRGLGLSITRSIVTAAGGLIHAANRDPAGACFQIELPVTH